MKKVSLLVAIVVVAAIMMSACASSTSAAETSTEAAATTTESTSVEAEAEQITIAMLPKIKGENYFDACKTGAEDAVSELVANGLDVKLIYDGPPQDAATNQKQVNILEGWIAQGVDAIVVAPIDPAAIAPTLKKAMDAGISVITYDSDGEADSRDLFVNQVTADGIGKGLVQSVSDQLSALGYGPDKPANVAIIGAVKTDANVKSWVDAILKYLAEDEYQWLLLNDEEKNIIYTGVDATECQQGANTLISRMGAGDDQIQGAMAMHSFITPAMGAAYDSAADKPDYTAIAITGLSTPNSLKTYIKDETNPMQQGVLWNCMDLGYLATMTAYQMVGGELSTDSASITTSVLGEIAIDNQMIVLGDALIFDASNIDQYDY